MKQWISKLGGLAMLALAGPAWAPPLPAHSAGVDTVGTGLMHWAYDTWTVPWVQVRGGTRLLAPESHATLMTLYCEASDLERDRLVRHLSAEECEHRMAAIRADQDTALVFRLDLRVRDRSGASELLGLRPRVKVALEVADGWRWSPVDVRRGLVVGTATGQKPKQVPLYQPQWMRGSAHGYGPRYEPTAGEPVTMVEYRIRVPRRDPATGQPLLKPSTRWLRLRLSYLGDEWVATWEFRPEEGRVP